MKSIKIEYALGFIVLLTLASACSTSTKDDSTTLAKEANDENFETRKGEKEANFVVDAVTDNYASIKLAQLARNKSTNPEVRDMATLMENDHTSLTNELKAYANKNGISIPLEESEGAKKDIRDLSEKVGIDFDKKWCSIMIDKHEKTIKTFEDRWNKTEDNDLKDWINTTLPELRTHLEMLTAHQEKVKNAKQ